MEDFVELSKKLSSYSNNNLSFTVDSFNTHRGVSHLDMINLRNLESFIERSLVYFLSLYKEKLNYKEYEEDSFMEGYFKKAASIGDKVKCKKRLEISEKDLVDRLLDDSEEDVKGLSIRYNITEKRAKGLLEKNATIKDKIIEIRKEIDILNSAEEDFKKSTLMVVDIYNKIDLNNKRNLNSAEFFANSVNKGSLALFLSKKIDEGTKWKFTKSQKYEEVIFFKDGSIATIKDDIASTVDPVGDNYNKLARDICDCFVEFKFRKNQSYIPKIKELLSSDNYKLNILKNMSDTFLNNTQLLKNYNFDLRKAIDSLDPNAYRRLEKIDDSMNALIEEHKINQLFKSIFSNKYKHLTDQKTKDIFKKIYDLKIDVKDVQKYVGAKLASFKTNEDLNRNLNMFLNKYNDFNIDSVKLKASNFNSEVILEDESSIVIKINNYESCKELGSSSWCIARDESYFNSYSSNGNKQYFYFDFTKDSSNETSMIGFTIKENGELDTSHLKNDDFIDFDIEYSDIYYSTIKKDIKSFNLSDELKDKLKYKIKNKQGLKI